MEPDVDSVTENYDDRFPVAGNRGFRVLLTPPNYLAAMGFAGYDITPGYTTSIVFDITEHARLSEPYSECRKTRSIKLSANANVPYSYVECRNLCIHKIVREAHGCYPTRYVTRIKNYGQSCVIPYVVAFLQSRVKLAFHQSALKVNHTSRNCDIDSIW